MNENNALKQAAPDILQSGFSAIEMSTDAVAANEDRYERFYMSDISRFYGEIGPALRAGLDALDEGVDFYSTPIHIGLDSNRVTESQRNAVIIELERQGANVGLQPQILFPQNRQGRIAMTLKGDAKSERDKRDIIDRFLAEMERYDAMYHDTLRLLMATFTAIDERIAELDAEIEAHSKGPLEDAFHVSGEQDKELKQAKEEKEALQKVKKNTLVRFKKELSSEDSAPSMERLHDIQDDLDDLVVPSTTSAAARPHYSTSRLAALRARVFGRRGVDAESAPSAERPDARPRLEAD